MNPNVIVRNKPSVRSLWVIVGLFIMLGTGAKIACAQVPDAAEAQKSEDGPGTQAETMFPETLDHGRLYLSGQMNFIYQTNPPFYAKYSGPNSFQPYYQKATSRVMTFYSGYQFSSSTEALVDVEEAGGQGLSQALGIAGYPNLDVVRNPTLSQSPYLARVMFHQVIALSDKKVESDPNPLSTFAELPARRLEFRAGKFGMADFFDINGVGSDSHLQFMNWAIDQNGAYDYAADTRGYTWGAILEYQDRLWGFRFAEALMPSVANGIHLVWNLSQARGESYEFELHRGFLPRKDGTVRLLSFVNHANMGIYRVAISQYLDGEVPKPDITRHPLQTTMKYGFGINLEQSLTKSVTAYGRFGWNNGKTESYAYTEIDQTFSGGVAVNGRQWGRARDRCGVAAASNAISRYHQAYLALGGDGFILGDGALNYGRENILEGYYTAHLWRGFYASPDIQYVVNPGYNRDRGPVIVPGVRLHIEL